MWKTGHQYLVAGFMGALLLTPVFVIAENQTAPLDLTALITQLQEQIKDLQSQIVELKTRLAGTEQNLEAVKTEIRFTKVLAFGSQGDEVKKLQEILKSMPDVYPEGLVTGYYGPLTAAAVRRLQERQGIEPLGMVGPKTIAALNSLNVQVEAPGLLVETISLPVPTQPSTALSSAAQETTTPSAPTSAAASAVVSSSTPVTAPAYSAVTTSSTSLMGVGTGTQTSSITTTACEISKTIDLEDDPAVGSNITTNLAYGAATTSIVQHAAWLTNKGIAITGSPAGFIWSTRLSGGAGQTGVVIGFASPAFGERDEGFSDDESLHITLLQSPAKSITLTITSFPSTADYINNTPIKLIAEGYDNAGVRIATTTKIFTGVTKGILTPTQLILTANDFKIVKVVLTTPQHANGGVWLESVAWQGACPTISAPASTATPISVATTTATTSSTPTTTSSGGGAGGTSQTTATTTTTSSTATTTSTTSTASSTTTVTTPTTTTTSTISPTGICQVRNNSTSVVTFSAPDLGIGYAKLAKPGVNTINGLRSSCTQSDYDTLLTNYCTSNSTPVQQEVVTYDNQGNWLSTGGGPFGDNPVSCPSASTPSSPLSAPTIDFFQWGSLIRPCRNNLSASFHYQRTSNSQAFNVYIQYPNNPTFTKYTYQIPAGDYINVSGLDNTTLTGAGFDDASGRTVWQWASNTLAKDTFTNGTYRFYVTVTGTDGSEGPASSVLTNTLNDGPAITSPAASVSQFPFTISLSNTISNLYYKYFIVNETSQQYESSYTSQSNVSVSNANLVTGNTYQVVVDIFDNPNGAFSTTKQKCALSNFNFVSPATTLSTAPAAPSNFTATLLPGTVAGSNIALTWTDNANNETGYYLESTISNAYLPANQQSYIFGNISPGTYYFIIKAYISDDGSYLGNKVLSSSPTISVTATLSRAAPAARLASSDQRTSNLAAIYYALESLKATIEKLSNLIKLLQ